MRQQILNSSYQPFHVPDELQQEAYHLFKQLFFRLYSYEKMTISLPKNIAKKRSDFKKNLIQLQNPITYLAFRRPIEFVFPYVYFKTIKIDIVYERIFLRNAHTSKTVSIQKPEYYLTYFMQKPIIVANSSNDLANLSFSYNG